MASVSVSQAVIRFGVFEADLRAGELRREGVKVRIQDLPFRALALLLSRPGVVISRDEFRNALWAPDVFVDFEQGISSAVMRLRDALGDSADNPIFVETVERRGYRWIAPVHPLEITSEAAREKVPALPQKAPAAPTMGTFFRRPLLFLLPVLAIVFVVWTLRRNNPDVRAAKSGTVVTRSGSHHVANREAEDFYLSGRFYWNKRTPESLNRALDSFNKAIAKDPKYADAYVGLADCYNLLREFSVMPANEAYFKAFAAAKKAVELDPESSDAHTSLAFVTYWGMWDPVDAEKEFRRAIELDPNNSHAHHWYATFLHAIQRSQDAVDQIELARELDPNSAAILADKGMLLMAVGQQEQGIELLRQLESADPNFISPHRYLRFAYYRMGDYANYIAEFKQEALLRHDPADLAEAEVAEKGFEKGGKRGMLEAQLGQQKKLFEQGQLSPFFLAQTEVLLGDKRAALRYLTICVQAHDEHVVGLSSDPHFARLHGNPEFEQLLLKIAPPSLG